ncbi:cold shock domain-containing protein [Myroides sp. JBRI-B21084]|uniref:cold shock domain-containing protein n=1 Tax=Myroides sp. JBRI-B21084 TaxID=3119977 RepID=UPI0026E32BB2|nr:cold shock domain-containing protein [Paenimyroides cloacae]WKW46115.1 cold shock domain-containing protein [Paenimyroides cloacae]
MADSFSKKENNKKKTKRLQDKQLRREDRKANNNKGKSLEDMIVYVDVNGNFTSVPPHLQNKEEDLAKAMKKSKSQQVDSETVFVGIVTHISDKGYGFITEEKTGESVFFHMGQAIVEVKKHEKVSFKKELTPKGFRAIDIKK